ncbi:MAG: ComF family protein [Candidatus Omnitrophota bacterium]
MFKSLSATVLDIIYPRNCINCKNGIFDKDYGFSICRDCFENIQKNRPPFCLKCGRHLDGPETDEGVCRQCKSRKFYFDNAWSVCIYEGIIQELIHKFKYSNKTMLDKVFAKLIFDFVMNFNLSVSDYDIMLPVPLHPTRLREREYNQCRILAHEIQNFFSIAISTNDVMRLRNTKSQISLDKKARWENIKGAFKVKNTLKFKDKNVLIIDDLITTGATASELARALKNAGTKNVSVLTLAIAK